MLLIERIKLLCEEKNLSIRRLEIETGLSTGSISKWSKSSPSLDSIQKIAHFFGVSLDYLAGNCDTKIQREWKGTVNHPDLFHQDIGLIEITNSNKMDLQKRLSGILTSLQDNGSNLTFDGELMDQRTKELFAVSLENLIDNTRNKFRTKHSGA